MSDETHAERADSAPENAPEKAPRKPEYGELAPEGWVNPVTGKPASESSASGASGATGATTDTVAGSTTAPASTAAANLSGVPHNLGKGRSRKSDGTESVSATPAAPAAPAAPDAPTPATAASATTGRVIPPTNIRIDRIATIILLGAGAIGALNLADSFMQLPILFAQLYALFELGEFTAPAWFGALATVGWVSQLLIWALTLLLSIQRIRRQKLAFFVPLAGALLSAILTFTLMAIALTGSPELFTYLSTNGFSPEQFQELQ